MLFVLHFLKWWHITKTLMVFFQLASTCEACEWVSEISAKLFPNRRFLFSKNPHIWRFVWNYNSQQTKNIYYILYLDQNMTIFLLVVRLASAHKWVPKIIFCFQKVLAPHTSWNNNSPQTNNVFLSNYRYRCLCWCYWQIVTLAVMPHLPQTTTPNKHQLHVSLTQNLWRTF